MTSSDILAVLDKLEINYTKTTKRVSFPCPLHLGDNSSAIGLLLTEPVGCWKCFTRGCQDKYGKGFYAFVKGVLSVRNGREYSWPETKEFIHSIIGYVPEQSYRIHSFTDIAQNHTVPDLHNMGTLTRQQVRSKLEIPSKYYIERGFSSKILDEYDVGTCLDQSKTMANRAVAPIYDLSGRMCGCTARSIFDKCESCQFYHSTAEGCSDNKFVNASRHKWKHGYNFKAGQYLYNLWRVHEELVKTKVAILVESPGNVWRLVEAGVKNAVAILGSSLSSEQLAILNSFGVMTLVLLFDNDPAGKLCKEKVIENCSRSYNIINVELPAGYNDIGDMSVDDIHKFILPRTII